LELRADGPAFELERPAAPPPPRSEIADPIRLDEPGRYAPLVGRGCTSALFAPLSWQGRNVGALLLGARAGRRRYGPQDLALAEDVASRAAAALEGARRLQETQVGRAQEARRAVALELAHR